MIEQTNQSKKTAHRYSTEDEQMLFDRWSEAKRLNMDMNAVYALLAEEIGTTEKAIQQKLYEVRKKYKSEDQQHLKLLQPNKKLRIVVERDESIVSKVQQLVEEREYYKALAEDYKAQLDAINEAIPDDVKSTQGNSNHNKASRGRTV